VTEPLLKRKVALATLIVLIVILVGPTVEEVGIIYFSHQSQISDVYALSDEKASSVDKRLVSSNTKFALNIFKELCIEDTDKNVFISPLSISIALSMTLNGAEGTTRDAMARTLQLGNMSLEEINQGYSTLIESLENADSLVKLGVADSIWINDSFEPYVKQDFTQRVKEYFGSEVFSRDFGSPQTPDEINGWISNKTEGKIDKMVDEISPELVMFLINAIYFKGEWVTSFNESATKEADFFLSNGSTVEADMMSTKGNFSFYEWKDFKVARFPYGRDKIAMYVFLPNSDVTIDSFVESLNQDTIENYLDKLSMVKGLEVEFPKFKLEYGVKRLNDVLEKLGMGIAFDKFNANFSGIAPAQLFIDYVDHKAVIEVNEKGTVAAAATVVGIALGLAPSEPTFIVDRPFFFVIRDDRSGTILFMGKVVNPTAI
jgi:serine protease inhibitor